MIGTLVGFEDAQARAKDNKARTFQRVAGDGRSGYERAFLADFPDLALNPSFKLEKGQSVFTIGSCFARNIEWFLAHNGMSCPTASFMVEDGLYERTGIGARNGAINAYTSHAMRDIIHLPEWDNPLERGALQVDDDLWSDMLVTGLRFLSTSELYSVRRRLSDTYRTLRKADAVFITLGYTETWFDNLDGVFVNKSPANHRSTRKHADRYKFMNADVVGVRSALEDMVAHIRALTNDRAKIILTVSPVPLAGTFTHRDVVVANQYSKATLHSAAIAMTDAHDFIDYFPSYEMVTMCRSGEVWEHDGVHVKTAFVKQIMQRFMAAYLA